MKHFLLTSILGTTLLCGTANAQTVTVPQSSEATWDGKSIDEFYRYVGPDFDIQGGGGYHWDTTNGSETTPMGFGRFRMGAMWIPTWPWSFSFGATFEANNLPEIAGTHGTTIVGAQAEALHLGSGIWLRGGTGVDFKARPHVNAALGWSLFGAEVQTVSGGPNGFNDGVALLATVRIPLGYLVYAFDKQ